MRALHNQEQKKADVADHPKVFDHVGLLFSEPLGRAELPFIPGRLAGGGQGGLGARPTTKPAIRKGLCQGAICSCGCLP